MGIFNNLAEARRCISTKPIPDPYNEFRTIKYKYSLGSMAGTTGSAWSRVKISDRFFILPHANSPESKIFFKCLLMAGTFTPNKEAMLFWVSQTVSSFKKTSAFTSPVAEVYSRKSVWLAGRLLIVFVLSPFQGVGMDVFGDFQIGFMIPDDMFKIIALPQFTVKPLPIIIVNPINISFCG